ncbi:amino acid adenylation domain-containing protein [Variovorax boronicumulans]|uniref:amino acid adenylation domain-containing protein n=1 Tax=Variovorax boronicumulans TaxID=436515 RepID=UPI0024753503|nr:amino acid adenylation domain-containing protein [Variovorax boronicumulans]MDH6168358.1 amino acid adenylation domain-containing protein [Variovorax boronicumulans]
MSERNDLSERRAKLSPAQLALLQRRLRRDSDSDAAPAQPSRDAIARSVDDGAFVPVSFAQQGQWFLWQLDAGNTAYHVGGGLGFAGPLDIAALQQAVQALAMRHDTLRTVFRSGPGGLPEQRVVPESRIAIPFVDLSGLDAASRASRYRETVHAVCRTPFDLTAGPLLRGTLLKMAEGDHQLLLTMHHIGSDAWSVELILDELARFYAQRVGEVPAGTDPEPEIRYADFARWQRKWLESAEGARQLAHWQRRLGGSQPVLELTTDRPRSADAKYSAAQYMLDVPAHLARELKQHARTQGNTLFAVLLAAFHALLFRYTGQDEIRIGVPVAGRNRPETAGVVGAFINTVVMDARLHPRMSLAELLAQVRNTSLDAQAHQELPFERLVQALRPDRAHAGSPLFQVMFNHLGEGNRPLRGWPGLQVRRIDLGERAAPFELILETAECEDGGIRAAFRYAAELFEPATIERLAGHYRRVLEAFVAEPTRALGDLALLDEAELAELAQRAGSGGRTRETATAQTVHGLIEQQAAAQPEAVAVVFEQDALSYRELNQRANRLAHRLIAQGVQPETRVGVAMERGTDLVVALLAVMKAGGAYVPLDPEYPADRIACMVEDSGLALVLTHDHLCGRMALPAGIDALAIDTVDLADCPATDPVVPLDGDNLAYVIYTSGSTGRPKGAQLCHRNVTRLLASTEPWFRFGPADVWTLFHSYAFDFSVWEMFGALCTGGKLVVVPFWVSRSPADFLRLLRTQQVTVLNQTPSAFGQLIALPEALDKGLSLRTVIFGGEALEPQRLRAWIEHHGDRHPQLVNMYGITETTVHVTWRRITAADLGQQRSPVGIAIPDLGLRVLDADLNLVPPGVAGELHVSGAGLARGYLNRAGLTAERFIATENGDRLYRTGDLVRWNVQGQLEYLGRIDHQVKVRGFRIELGEIEAQLLAQPQVREAIVIAREHAGATMLVAYLSAQPGKEIDSAQVRARLGRALPEYMVPGAIVALQALPLNANGKVDRKALPEPGFGSERAYAAPEGDAEEALARIWCEVLGVARVGRNDHFFELGGHSLMSMQVMARVQGAMHVDLAVRDIFQNPVLMDMARLIAEAGARKPHADALSDIDSFIDSLETT